MKNVEGTVKVLAGLNSKTAEVNGLVNTSDKLAASVGASGKSALASLDEIKKSTTEVDNTISQVNTSVKNVVGFSQ